MDEEVLELAGPVGRLDARLRDVPSPRAVLAFGAPHPLLGGTMESPVVTGICAALHREGVATLRFDWRGAGRSAGRHDRGRGEQADLAAALSALRARHPRAPALAGGFSFGAWVALESGLGDAVLAVGLPVGRSPLRADVDVTRPMAILQGAADETGSPADVRRALRGARRARLWIVESCDHWFVGQGERLAERARAALRGLLAELSR